MLMETFSISHILFKSLKPSVKKLVKTHSYKKKKKKKRKEICLYSHNAININNIFISIAPNYSLLTWPFCSEHLSLCVISLFGVLL